VVLRVLRLNGIEARPMTRLLPRVFFLIGWFYGTSSPSLGFRAEGYRVEETHAQRETT